MRRAGLLLLAVVGLGACRTGPTAGSVETLHDWHASDSPPEAFGGQVSVIVDMIDVRGELLGCDASAIYVRINLPEESEAYRRYDLTRVSRLTVFRAGSAGGLAAWTVAGTLSTATHGVFLVLSAPLWMIIGSATTAATANQRALEIHDRMSFCRAARPYARFPGGLPEVFRQRFGLAPPPDRESSPGEREPPPDEPDAPQSPY